MPHIRHTLLIAATTEEVYRAITCQEGLAAWWTPGVTASPEKDSIARFNFGPAYYKEMKITNLQPTQLVTWLCTAGAAEWIGTGIGFELATVDAATLQSSYPEMAGQAEQQATNTLTLLHFHHDNWKNYTAMFAECNYTWSRFLWSLKLYCETGKGLPWPQQHRV